MAEEKANDKLQTDSIIKFKINTYNVIFDQVIPSLQKHFENHSQLYNDFSIFNSRVFL